MTISRPGTARILAMVFVGATALAFVVLAAALHSFLAGLAPLDLSPAAQRSTVILDRDGKLLRAYTTEAGRWRLPIELADIDPRFVAMLLAYEDRRFRSHGGVDPLALIRAAGQALGHGRVISGGSTLTMQVARLFEPQDDRTVSAKARQIARALEIERRFSKEEILRLYFALAPYGGNLEGIRAASWAYFGKEPRRLSHAEAALLAALPQSPEARRPDRFPETARRARDRVLDRAMRAGLIARPDGEAAKAEPVPQARKPFPVLAAHAGDAVVAERPAERIHRLTLDAKIQASLEALLRERVERLGPKLNGAILVLDNASGELRAHVGGADYFSAERAGSVDMAEALRSPGSALKPFVYALAFENGIAHPETILEDRPARYGAYLPQNFDLEHQGTVTARRALQMSLNVATVQLLEALGPARFVGRLRSAGVEIVLPDDTAPGLAVGLGGVGIRLADAARLFSALARGGEVPALVRRLGEPAPREPRRLVDPAAAWYVADILAGVPPPFHAAGGRIAFKTGTSFGYRDAWAIGFDRRHTVAVWVGRPDGTAVPGLIAREVAAPILFDAFARIGGEPEPLPAPPGVLIATTAKLPPPLKHLRRDAPKTIAAASVPSLRIAYPPDGARIDLGLTAGRPSSGATRLALDAAPLALKASGGVPPLLWMVNGVPIGAPDLRRATSWIPDGAGFARVSVVDASGATDSVLVRVE